MIWNAGRFALTLLMIGTMTGTLAAQTPQTPQTVELVSRVHPSQISDTAAGSSVFAGISADGRYVAFYSTAPNIVAGQKDTNGAQDVFLHDQIAGTTVLVSHASDSASATGNAAADRAQISADGRYVLFQSGATNLIPGQIDTPNSRDIFLFDRITGAIALVSRSSASAQKTGNREAGLADLSANGRFVVFMSAATDLVSGQNDADHPSPEDVFVYDRVSGTTSLVSRSAGSATKTANADSAIDGPGSISADGSQILFSSSATDLLPGGTVQGSRHFYLFHRPSGNTVQVSRGFESPDQGIDIHVSRGVLSVDGNFVAFTSDGQHVPGVENPQQLNLLYLYNRTSGAVTSVTPSGTGENLEISADGRYVLFNRSSDVFLYDRIQGATTRVSQPLTNDPGLRTSSACSISADGRYTVFVSDAADLIPGQADDPGTADLFLYDHGSRTTRRLTHTDPATPSSAASAGGCKISSDGRYVGFSDLMELGPRDLNRAIDVFLYERSTDTTLPVSVRMGEPSMAAGLSRARAVSADGRYVLFQSTASNILAGQVDANENDLFFDAAGYDLFLYDRVTKTTVLVSRSAASPATTGNGASIAWVSFPQPVMSADGRYVIFLSRATNLVPGQVDLNEGRDVFLFDRVTGATTIVSRSAASPTTTGNGDCFASMVLSTDGRYAAFSCTSSDLVPGQIDDNQNYDVFLYDRVAGSTLLVTHAAGFPATAAAAANDQSFGFALSSNGRYAVFESRSTNLVPGQSSQGENNTLLFDRASGTTTLITSDFKGVSSFLGVSDDGRYAYFERSDGTYLFNRDSGVANLVAPRGDYSKMSADGRFIAFSSSRNNVIPGQVDTNSGYDIFLYDRTSGATTLVSRAASPTTAGNRGNSPAFSITPDASRIAFSGSATNLIPGFIQTPAGGNVFLYQRNTGSLTLVSRTPASPLRPGNDSSFDPVLSADGRSVAFDSRAIDLAPGDQNLSTDVYLYSSGSSGTGPVPLPTCKLLDTRRRADRPVLTSNVQRTVTARGACGVPATAKQVVVKVTVFNPSGKGNLRFYPGAVTATPSGILRFERAATRTETFTLPLSANGTLTVLPFVANRGTVHGVVEVTGYSN